MENATCVYICERLPERARVSDDSCLQAEVGNLHGCLDKWAFNESRLWCFLFLSLPVSHTQKGIGEKLRKTSHPRLTKKSEKGQRSGAFHLQSRRELDGGQDVLEKMPTLQQQVSFCLDKCTTHSRNLFKINGVAFLFCLLLPRLWDCRAYRPNDYFSACQNQRA
jgi:hypothetical protein